MKLHKGATGLERMVFDTPEALGEYSAALIDQTLTERPGALLCISAGDTQRPMLAAMRAWAGEQRARLQQARFILLDEWAGLTAADAGGCEHFMRTQLLDPLGVPAGQVRRFDATAIDLHAQVPLREQHEGTGEQEPANQECHVDKHSPAGWTILGCAHFGAEKARM